MSKGFSYYYMIECYEGFKNNQTFKGKTFNELYRNFKGCHYKPHSSKIKEFVEMYDSGTTGAYYRIHCVFVYPDGKEKIIYTCEGI